VAADHKGKLSGFLTLCSKKAHSLKTAAEVDVTISQNLVESAVISAGVEEGW